MRLDEKEKLITTIIASKEDNREQIKHKKS